MNLKYSEKRNNNNILIDEWHVVVVFLGSLDSNKLEECLGETKLKVFFSTLLPFKPKPYMLKRDNSHQYFQAFRKLFAIFIIIRMKAPTKQHKCPEVNTINRCIWCGRAYTNIHANGVQFIYIHSVCRIIFIFIVAIPVKSLDQTYHSDDLDSI